MEKKIEKLEKKINVLEKILGLNIDYYTYLDPEDIAKELSNCCSTGKIWSSKEVFIKKFCRDDIYLCNECRQILTKYNLPLKIVG